MPFLFCSIASSSQSTHMIHLTPLCNLRWPSSSRISHSKLPHIPLDTVSELLRIYQHPIIIGQMMNKISMTGRGHGTIWSSPSTDVTLHADFITTFSAIFRVQTSFSFKHNVSLPFNIAGLTYTLIKKCFPLSRCSPINLWHWS